MTSMFDMAIDHFWRAQQAVMKGNTDQLESLGQIANGLQLFCAAVKARQSHPDNMFQMAITHFWRAQEALIKGSPNQIEALGQMANGLQLFCAATKRSQ